MKNIQQDKVVLVNLILSEISRCIADDWTKIACSKNTSYFSDDRPENEITLSLTTDNPDPARSIKISLQYKCSSNMLRLHINQTGGWFDRDPGLTIDLRDPKYISVRKHISAVYRQYRALYEAEHEALEIQKLSDLLFKSIPHIADQMLLED